MNLTAATITPTGGSAIQNQIVTPAKDPQSGALMKASDAYVLPLTPLKASTTYQVNLAGSNNGVAFAKSFLFTTAQ